ncbi:hypothetical protein evm_005471 [Chilo suppressalis]|nr:hypothetical protein evm_005471 [Chilo suppressalis]
MIDDLHGRVVFIVSPSLERSRVRIPVGADVCVMNTSICTPGCLICDIYEARRALLGGKEPVITAEVPESYNIPAISTAVGSFGAFNPFSPQHSLASPCSPYVDGFVASPLLPQSFPSPLSPALTPPAFPSWLLPSPPPRHTQFPYPMPSQMYKNQQPAWNPMGNNVEMNMQQPMMMPQYQQMPESRPTSVSQLLNSSSQASSGYQSNFTGSSVSLDTQNISGGDNSNVVSPSVSPISKAHSPQSARDQEINELANIISDLPLSERRAVGCEKKTLETLNKLSPLSDYRKLKADANKSLAPANPHWARVVMAQSPYSIHGEGLCPSSGDINRLMMMMMIIIQEARIGHDYVRIFKRSGPYGDRSECFRRPQEDVAYNSRATEAIVRAKGNRRQSTKIPLLPAIQYAHNHR